MIVADIQNLNFDGTAVQTEGNRPFEPFYCPTHPSCKIEALCTKEGFQPSLMCVKCLIDPKIQKQVRAEQVVPIHDIINKAASPSVASIRTDAMKEKLEKRFSEFTSKDHVEAFDEHIKTQMRKLDREFESIKESLEELRFQFQQIFEKQSHDLRKREEELVLMFKDFMKEQELIDSLTGATLVDIVSTIQRMDDIKDYERFLKALHLRNTFTNPMVESLHLQELFSCVTNFKSRINAMRRCRIDTSKLEDIRRRIESIEMLDKSLQTLPGHLDLQLNQTLEKVLRTEGKKTAASEGINTPPIYFGQDTQSQEGLFTYAVDVGTQTPSVRYYREPVAEEWGQGGEEFGYEDEGKKGMDIMDEDLKHRPFDELHEEETAYRATEGNSPQSLVPEKSERAPKTIYDWINRRVTGYLIFHNEINDNESVEEDKEIEDAHLNRVVADRWHGLTKLEREEYMALAMTTRVKLKKKLKDLDLEDPDAEEIKRKIHKKFKKLKLH